MLFIGTYLNRKITREIISAAANVNNYWELRYFVWKEGELKGGAEESMFV